MRFVEPLAHRADAVLARRNPVAKLGAVTLVTLGLLATLDPVAPSVVLLVELAVVPLFGLSFAVLGRRILPLLYGVAATVVALLLFSERTGRALGSLGPLHLTTGTVNAAVSVALRILAIALPGIIVLATTDPTDLADALVQNVKASPRFAIGALAAVRLMPLLGEEWRMLTLARRARGLDAGRNPLARVRVLASLTFALLVGAIRRGTRLATAMDARGFDSGLPRSIARPQRFGAADWLLVVAGGVVAAAAIAASVLTGVFSPLLG
jgi:energy-coupling factor transport system permease protein